MTETKTRGENMKKIVILVFIVVLIIGQLSFVSSFWNQGVNAPGNNDNTGNINTGRFNVFGQPQAVSAGNGYTVVIDYFGRLWTFGSNVGGRTGIAGLTIGASLDPVLLDTGDTRFRAVEAGNNFGFAIDTNNRLWSWGTGSNGVTGLGVNGGVSIPQMINPDLEFQSISVGITGTATHAVAIDFDGNLWSWGNNASGRTGHGVSSGNTLLPRMIEEFWPNGPTTASFVQVSAGSISTLAIDIEGRLWSWGNNDNGRAGHGPNYNYADGTQVISRPRIIDSTSHVRFTYVAASHESGYAICIDGSIWVFGVNLNAKLGTGNLGTTSETAEILQSPTRLVGEIDEVQFVSITAGQSHAIAIDSEGSVWSWGQNSLGRTGHGVGGPTQAAPGHTTVPTRIVHANIIHSQFEFITAGNDFSFAIDSDGFIYSWGAGASGRNGNGALQNRAFPIRLLGHQ